MEKVKFVLEEVGILGKTEFDIKYCLRLLVNG